MPEFAHAQLSPGDRAEYHGGKMLKLKILVCFAPLLVAASTVAYAQPRFSVFEASIVDMQAAMEAGAVSSEQLVEQYLQRIAAYDKSGPVLNSIIRINSAALAQAKALDDERRSSGPRSLLHGIPIVVKDNYNTTTMPTTGGSVALAAFLPSANATQIDKLTAAGAIIIAKANLHEYAYGITTVGSLIGQTRNPYDLRRVPGGSSGGTAAAVAANLAAVGFGSDTCGSIRIPSAFNNLIGLRLSKGLSSIYGVLPLSHTQDVAGPLARNSMDLAIVLDQVVGFDPLDPATHPMQSSVAPGFVANLESVDLSKLRIGKLLDYFAAADSSTRRMLESALSWYEAQGSVVVDIDASGLRNLIAASGLIGHEFEVDLNNYLREFASTGVQDLEQIVRLGLHHEAVSGVLGRSARAERDEDAYQAALSARTDLRQEIEEILAQNNIDVLVYPSISETAVQIGEVQPGNNCSLSANSGLPALSMPVGFSSGGLPVGMELLGGFLKDADLLAIAHAYEQESDTRLPPPTAPPLVNGEAPGNTQITMTVEALDVALRVGIEIDHARNELNYNVSLDADSADRVYAVTLVRAETEASANSAVVLKSLIGPQQMESAGGFFMSPAIRDAVIENRLFLRVFADSYPLNGISWKIE